MSLYYALTSLTAEEGTWHIIADGDSFDGVLEAAKQALVGADGAVTEYSLPLSKVSTAAQVRHLRVYLKPRAVHVAGSGAMQRYEFLTQGVTQGINSSGGAGSGTSGNGSGGPQEEPNIPPM